jgi:hypothetical protein
MLNWSRNWNKKCLCNIAWVAKECARDEAIPPGHRERFEIVHRFVKDLSNSPQAGDSSLGEAIVALCGACNTSVFTSCQPREHLHQPCSLISTRLYG